MNRFFKSVIGIMSSQLCRAYLRTLKVVIQEPTGRVIPALAFVPRPVIYAHCESDILQLLPMLLYSPFIALVDASRDGDRAARLLKPLGLEVVRGSSLHLGFTAVRQFLRKLEKTLLPAAVCIDGPLGPVGVPKEGVFLISRHSRRTILPVATRSSRCWECSGSWSKMRVPLPFSRIVIAVEQPINPQPDRKLDELGRELRERLVEAGRRAGQLLRAES